MKILILTHAEVEELLPVREGIPVMAEALADLARGNVFQPLRMVITPPDADGDMALMPSYRSGERAAYGVKTVCFFPGNPAKGLDAHQGSVMLFSAETGELVALMNASAITAIRTAAVSGVATQLLAREDASELAIIGSGVQARAHIEAMACVRSNALESQALRSSTRGSLPKSSARATRFRLSLSRASSPRFVAQT